MGDIGSSAVSGVEVRGYRRGTLSTDDWDQYVVPVKDRITSWQGRVCTYVTPGRGAATQKIFALHNATGSAVIVCVNRIRVDLLSLAAAGKVITVAPPVIRVVRFTAIPTNGTVITTNKVPFDTNYGTTGSASVTAWGDATSTEASGAGTSSGTALTVTTGLALSQTYAPRMLVVGTSASTFYEPVDTVDFFVGEPDVILRPLEGICVFLDASVAAGIPTTDKFIVTCDFEEFTRP